jgi:methylated-DNA-[protein]-cysteine S-methyltransferase
MIGAATGVVRIVLLETRVGLVGIAESALGLEGVRVSYPDADSLRDALLAAFPTAEESEHSQVGDLFDAYARGKVVSFDDLPINDRALTPFRRTVTVETRKIPYGQTLSYAELAQRAGSPQAFRAVGSTMANNRWAIVVPCHRVLASGGKIGGYSAPQGLRFKERLLAQEGISLPK